MSNGAQPDYEAIKESQRSAWETGDYHVIGASLQLVSEDLCEHADLRAGSTVLDVCTGSGNTAIAAARRWCRVTGVDYAPGLLELAEDRARAEHLKVDFRLGDAEALPFDDDSFDVVTSTFGVQFAPNQEEVGRELVRVCRPGGRIALANWGPGDFFATLSAEAGKYAPPPPGVQSPLRWGDLGSLPSLLEGARCLSSRSKVANYRYESPGHLIRLARTYYGPMVKAFEAAGDDADALGEALVALCEGFNTATDGTMVVPARYLAAVFEKD